MNQDLATKIVPFLNKRAASMLHLVTKDPRYAIYIAKRYRAKLNVISIEKVAMMIKKTIEMQRHDIAVEHLCYISSAKMIRVLFKLSEVLEPKEVELMFSDMAKRHFGLQRGLSDRYAVVISHMQSILKRPGFYAHCCR